MMILRVLAAGFAVGSSGFAIASLLKDRGWFFRITIGLALGVAIWGATFLPILFVTRPSPQSLVLKDLVLALLAGAVIVTRRTSQTEHIARRSSSSFARCGLLALAGLVVCSAASFTFGQWKHPEGDWDAWAIWNVRARFLYRSGEARLSFDPHLAHADYPPLLPALIAQCWFMAGRESVAAPIIIAAFFALMTVALLASALLELRGAWPATMAAAILLGTPLFVQVAQKQYADVPLASLALAAFALVAIALESDSPRVWPEFLLAGCAASCAALMKNEGMLFLLALLTTVTLIRRGKSDKRLHLSAGLTLVAGAIPILLIVLWFKTGFAPPNDLFARSSGSGLLARLTEGSRYLLILKASAVQLIHLGAWNVYLAIVAAGILAPLRGVQPASIKVLRPAIALVLAGFFLVYLATPYPLKWHLTTSLDRLLMQCWPVLIFLVFLRFIPRTAGQT